MREAKIKMSCKECGFITATTPEELEVCTICGLALVFPNHLNGSRNM